LPFGVGGKKDWVVFRTRALGNNERATKKKAGGNSKNIVIGMKGQRKFTQILLNTEGGRDLRRERWIWTRAQSYYCLSTNFFKRLFSLKTGRTPLVNQGLKTKKEMNGRPNICGNVIDVEGERERTISDLRKRTQLKE